MADSFGAPSELSSLFSIHRHRFSGDFTNETLNYPSILTIEPSKVGGHSLNKFPSQQLDWNHYSKFITVLIIHSLTLLLVQER
jgi:hypothetical protein